MGDHRDDRHESETELASELEALQRAQQQLWAALREEEDPEVRMSLLSRFSANRVSIVHLSEALGVETSPVSKPAYRVELVDPAASARAGGRQEPLAPVHQLNPFVDDRELDEEPAAPAPQFLAAPQLERAPLAECDPMPERDPGLVPPPFLDHAPPPERAGGPLLAAPSRPGPLGASSRSDQVDELSRFGRFEPPQDQPGDRGDARDQLSGQEQTPNRLDDQSDEELDDQFEEEFSDELDEEDQVDFYQPPQHEVSRVNQVNRFDQTRGREVHQVHSPDGDDYVFGRGGAMPPPAAPYASRPTITAPATGPTSAAGQMLSAAQESPRRLAVLAGVVVTVVAVAYLALTMPFGRGSEPNTVASELSSDTTALAGPAVDARVDEIIAVLRGLGYDNISVDDRDGVIYLSGTVGSTAERDAALGAARALAGDQLVDGSALSVVGSSVPVPAGDQGLSSRATAFQAELDRVVAATPIIFDVGETKLSELHLRILNTVASIMVAYPDLGVTIVGFTDESGPDDGNRQLSLARAEGVKDYLVSQGVTESALGVEPRGEETSTGSQALANLERRVEFEVVAPASAPLAPSDALLRIAIVAPSARNDLAFTQSMVDAANAIAAERGNVEVSITDNTFVPDEAAVAIRDFAAQDYDLVIAHGSQFGQILLEIAQEFPDVAFAWGTASDTFDLPNVYAYDAAAQQGGYVMGAMAGLLTSSGVVGVVGPIEVGDAQLYVNGFQAGVKAESPTVDVQVSYTGSFSDLTLAAETAQAHVDAGADVMTGSAQMVVGAVSIASENGALWFGTQSNQASLAPTLVVASQVYHWEVILRTIIADVDAGTVQGRSATADLANGGLVIEFNPSYGLPEGVRQRANQIIADVISGAIVVPNGA